MGLMYLLLRPFLPLALPVVAFDARQKSLKAL